MKYYEFKEKQANEIDEFPMHFAFSGKQYSEVLDRLGVKENEAKDKLLSVPCGGFIRKSDSKNYSDMFARQHTELKEALKDDTFLINAIEHELSNHEFCITYDPSDTINALALDMENERTKKCFVIAKANYMENVEY